MRTRDRMGSLSPRDTPPARPGARLRAGWVAATGTGAVATIAIGLLVAVSTFMAVAMPRASLNYRTAALQRMLAALPVSQRAVLGDADVSTIQGALTPAALAGGMTGLGARLAASGIPLAGRSQQWSGLSAGPGPLTGQLTLPDHIGSAQIELLYRSSLAASGRLVAGRFPSGARTLAGHGLLTQVTVSAATARSLRLRVGSRLLTTGQVLLVTGIVAPVRPGSVFWGLQPEAAAPQVVYPNVKSPPYLSVAAFVGGGAIANLGDHVGGAPIHALWSFPLDLRHLSADQAAGLAHKLGQVSFLPVPGYLAFGPSAGNEQIVINLSAGVVTPLAAFAATDASVQSVVSLLIVSLVLVAAVVVLLGARLVTEHRGNELALMRARGASLAQLAAVALGGSALGALPAAALAAFAATAATPGPDASLSWRLAGVTVAAALAGPPLMAIWAHRPRRGAAARPLLAARRRRTIAVARRWVVCAALVSASVAGLVLLRQQGHAGTDLFATAAPALTAIPVAVLITACLPASIGGLLWLASRRRGLVAVLGLARGNAATGGVLPVFALILALAVIAFAATARAAVSRGDAVASWQQVGADAVVTAPDTGLGITPRDQRILASVPGVHRAAALAWTTATTGLGLALPVVITDPASYAAVVAGTPAPSFPGSALARRGLPGEIPVLISPAAHLEVNNGDQLSLAGRVLRIRFAGSLSTLPGAPPGGAFAVLPRWALGSAAPPATVMVLTGPGLDTSALAAAARSAVPGARVTLRSSVLAAISSAPLPHGGYVTFAQGAAAAAGLMLLTLLLTLLLTARSRELTMARLVTMGLTADQWRRIVLVEMLPTVIAASVGGTVCALALVPLVGPAINLAAFTGQAVAVPLHADATVLVAAAAGLLVLGLLATAVQNRLARRRGAGQLLRAGG